MRRMEMWRNATFMAALAVVSCSSDEASGPRYNGGSGAGTGAGSNAGEGGFLNPENPGSGGAAGGSVAGASGASGSGGTPGGSCAEGLATTAPVTPTVWLVLDGSGSMNEDFSGETRWQALRAALMDDGGVIATLERNVRFGMVLYSGVDQDRDSDEAPIEPEPMPTECVNLTVVDPALSNYATLDAQLPDEEPGGWTPTDRALEHVVNTLPVVAELGPDQKNDPVYVVLATDGAPNDRCMGDSGGGGGNDFDEVTAGRVLDVVGAGAMKGVKLLVISLAGGDDELQSHLEEVSELSGTGFAPFVPSSRDELINTMQELIGGAGCQIALQGSVALDQACTGEVTLNGNPLACDDDNGFRLVDERTVQLEGEACTAFLSADSFVNARFPCGVFSPD